MPQKLKSGTILVDDGDLRNYLILCFGTTLFFFAIYALANMFMKKVEGKTFTDLDPDQKVWKNASFSTIFHHITNITLITYTMYFSCSNMDGMPGPTVEGGTFTKLESDMRWGWFRN